MNIKDYTASQLQAFINSDEFCKLKNIPISKPRALSHINNPRLSENDRIMFMAFDNDKFVGYLGAIPDYIFVDNKSQKIAWLSCMWVDKSMRGQGIAPKLLDYANKMWEGNLLIVNFTSTAKSSYDKIHAFTELKTYEGLRLYRRLNLSYLLPNKNKKAKNYLWLLKITDFGFNIFNDLKNHLFYKKLNNDIDIEYVNYIDKKTQEFILQKTKNNLTKRQKDELDWIMLYPWILTSPTKNIENERYEFSVSDKRFLAINIKIFYKKELIGFLMLSIRNKHMRIPYIYVSDNKMNIAANVIQNITSELRIDYITIFNSELINELKKSKIFFYSKTQYRTFLITEKLLNEYKTIKNYDFQDGDGDSAFT